MSEIEQIKPFNYKQLDVATASYLVNTENAMRETLGTAYTKIGMELRNAQELLSKNGYGCFEEWYTSLGFKKDKVYDLINRYNLIVGNSDKQALIEEMPLTLSYEVSKPNVDKELKQKVLGGDITTLKEYKELEKEKKELEKQVEELKNQEPKVIEVEKEVYPSDYLDKQKEVDELQEKLEKQIDPIEYERLRRELTDKNLELYDIKQQMEKEKVTIEDSKDVHLKKLKDTAIVFSNRVYSFINDVGGLGWLIEYLDEIPSYEQEEYIKAIELLDRWITTIKSNL